MRARGSDTHDTDQRFDQSADANAHRIDGGVACSEDAIDERAGDVGHVARDHEAPRCARCGKAGRDAGKRPGMGDGIVYARNVRDRWRARRERDDHVGAAWREHAKLAREDRLAINDERVLGAAAEPCGLTTGEDQGADRFHGESLVDPLAISGR